MTIFDALDSDMDNVISYDKIDVEAVSRDVARVLRPILSELEDLDDGIGSIDKQEFVSACMRLYQVSITQQYLLLIFLTSFSRFEIDPKCCRPQHNFDVPAPEKAK